MIACLLLLSPTDVNPRFYRVHFLTALGLAGLAAVFVRVGGGWPLGTLLLSSMVLALAGSISWLLDRAPGGRGADRADGAGAGREPRLSGDGRPHRGPRRCAPPWPTAPPPPFSDRP